MAKLRAGSWRTVANEPDTASVLIELTGGQQVVN